MSKIVAITGMCSSANKPTGYQFVPEDNKLVARGSFRMYGGGDEVVSDVAGNFYTAPTFKCTCGMGHLYQCKECGSFVCYDGKAHEKLQCPSCHALNYVPAAAPDGRIARSGKAGSAMVDIVLAIDTSSSMNAGGRLAVVKQAAVEEFVARYEGKCRMAVMSFDTKVSVLTPLTDNLSAVKRLIGGLSAYGGTTSPFGAVLRDAKLKDFRESQNKRYLVVFTDGEWAGDRDGNISSSMKIKDMGITILSIGCAGADADFLNRISSPDGSIVTTDSGIRSAFATVASKSEQ